MLNIFQSIAFAMVCVTEVIVCEVVGYFVEKFPALEDKLKRR